MIIALHGQSSSGKTTIANALRHRLGNCLVRHCGELVKARANGLGVSLNDLPDEEHRTIDVDTCVWSEAQTGIAIVEGRYLHWVLTMTCADVQTIEIFCNEAVRVQRWTNRLMRELGSNALSDMDAADYNFTATMYHGFAPLVPRLRVDTTSATVDECVTQILNGLELKAPTCGT